MSKQFNTGDALTAVADRETPVCEKCCHLGSSGEIYFVCRSNGEYDNRDGTFVNNEAVTEFRVGKQRGRRKGQICTRMKISESNLEGLALLSRVLSAFDIEASTQEDAARLYKQLCQKGAQRRAARALAGAVGMAFLRREKIKITFREVVGFCGCTIRDLFKRFRLVNNTLICEGKLSPSFDDHIRTSIESYALKIPAELNVSEVLSRAIELSAWIDECSMLHRGPPHLFALTMFYISFKSVNVETHFDMSISEFNSTFEFYPENSYKIPHRQTFSPKFVIDAICNIVNAGVGPSLDLTESTIFLLLDMVLNLKPHLKICGTEKVKDDVLFQVAPNQEEVISDDVPVEDIADVQQIPLGSHLISLY